MAERLRGCQDDHRAPRPPHSSLRYHRDGQRQLAIAKPCLTTASRSLATALYDGALARGLLLCSHLYLRFFKLLHHPSGSKLHADRGRIASSGMLLNNFPPMTVAASPNRIGVADGGA